MRSGFEIYNRNAPILVKMSGLRSLCDLLFGRYCIKGFRRFSQKTPENARFKGVFLFGRSDFEIYNRNVLILVKMSGLRSLCDLRFGKYEIEAFSPFYHMSNTCNFRFHFLSLLMKLCRSFLRF